MSLNTSACAETELRIDDNYLDANVGNENAVIDVVERTPTEAFITSHLAVPASGAAGRFNPRYISIDGSVTDANAGNAFVRRTLKNTLGRPVRQKYLSGIMHPQSVRQIYPYQTTARGISIYS